MSTVSPLTAKAFFAMISGMTIEEIGAYCMIWAFLNGHHGSWAVTEQGFANISRVSLYRWRGMADRVLKHFHVDGDIYSIPKKPRSYKPVAAGTKAFIFGRDGNRCKYCGCEKGPFEIDHIIPRVRGGTNDRDNLCVACHTCNRSKWAFTPEEWRQ